jgi:quercetin dioxygenase-like cupin family protein
VNDVTAAHFLAADADLADLGVTVEHAFGGGSYIKTTRFSRAGALLGQHQHDHDHLSCLVSGRVRLYVDGIPRVLEGYQTLTLEAGRMHAVESLGPAIWQCVWATEDTDPATVDQSILKGA